VPEPKGSTVSKSEVQPPSEWGTVQEAADRYKVSAKTIRRMITRGSIEAKRFGPRLIRVNLVSLDDAGRSLQYAGGDSA